MGESLHVVKTGLGIEIQGALHDLDDSARGRGSMHGQGSKGAGCSGVEEASEIGTRKGWLSAHKLVQQGAQGEDVGLSGEGGGVGDLLWGQVAGDRGCATPSLLACPSKLGDAEVGNLGDDRVALRGKQHLGRLYVSVEDAGGVSSPHGPQDLGEQDQGFLELHGPVFLDAVGQGEAPDELCNQADFAVGLEHLGDSDHVGGV